jgi:predicted TIM-barrel fold metal-dependent hydrolase
MSFGDGHSRRSVLAGCAALPLIARAGAAGAAPVRAAGQALFDAHIHFFTNDVRRYPVDLRNAREPEDVMRARILRAPVTPAAMLKTWDQLGIGGGLGVQYSGAYKADNSYVLDVARANPRRIGTEIILNPANPESPALLHRLAGTQHVCAVRLTGFVDDGGDLPWLKSPGALEIWATARELKIPVGITYLRMVPTSAALKTVRALSDRFPDCTIILEHLGWTGSTGTQDGLLPDHLALRDHRNIRFKWTTLNIDALSNAGIAPQAFLRAAADAFGPDRLMWGSDYGNTTRPYAGIVADAHAATESLRPAEAKAVLGGSARALFRI